MKNLILLLLFTSQLAWSQINNSVFPNLPYSDLSAVRVDGNNIFTYGNCGVSLLSDDGGLTWQNVEMDESIRAIRIVPGSNGKKALYLAQDAVYLMDMNTASFQKVNQASLLLSAGAFYSIEIKGNTAYLIASGAVFQTSTDNYNWTKLTDLSFNSGNDRAEHSDITDNILHITTFEGSYIRVDLNTAAVTISYDFGNRIYNLDMVSDDVGYMTVQGLSTPVKTDNGGSAFSSLPGFPENINVRTYGENVVVTVNTNRIYVSLDGGQTASYIPIPGDGYTDLVYDAFFTADGTFFLAGKSSMVLKSEDFGSSFENINEYKRATIRDIDINSSGLGYAVGDQGSVIKTTNNGLSWSELNVGINSDFYLNCVVVKEDGRVLIGASNGLVIMENDQIVQTIDKETTSLLYNEQGNYFLAVQRANGTTVIAKSTDNGSTWENKAFIIDSYSDLEQTNSGKIFLASGTQDVYTSTDGGETWDIETFSVQVESLKFYNNQRGVLVGNGKMYLTNDGGAHALEIASSYAIRNVQFFNENHILYTSAQNNQTSILESKNGGSTFALKGSFCATTWGSYFDGSSTVWLGQSGGHINKHNVDISVGTQDIPTFDAVIYPNPTIRGSYIAIEGVKDDFEKVKLFDLNGKLCLQSTLESGQQEINVPFDTKPGLYVVELIANNKRYVGKLAIL